MFELMICRGSLQRLVGLVGDFLSCGPDFQLTMAFGSFDSLGNQKQAVLLVLRP